MHSPVELKYDPAAQGVHAEAPEARGRDAKIKSLDCKNRASTDAVAVFKDTG
jgi:hypothetical protein